MKIGGISPREEGCFQWTIENFQAWWRTWWSFTSPLFVYNGLRYYVGIQKLTHTMILVSFNSIQSRPSNVIYVPFKFFTDCKAELQSKVYVSKRNDVRNSFDEILNFEGFLSKDLCCPLHQHLTIVFWIIEQNGESGKISERANKPLNKHTKSECESKSGKITENVNKPLKKDTKSKGKSGKISENDNKPLKKDTKCEGESKSGKISENGNKPLNKDTKSEGESKSGKITENANKPLKKDTKSEGKSGKISENANKPLNKDTKSECESKSGKISENANKPLNKDTKSEFESKSGKISENANKPLNKNTKSDCESKSGKISENANKHLNEETKSECETFEEQLKLCVTDPEKGDYVQLVQKKPLDASIQKFLSQLPSDEKNLILAA